MIPYVQDYALLMLKLQRSILKLDIKSQSIILKPDTLRVCSRSLMVFNGSDNAAKTTGVRRSSDMEAKKSLWNLLMTIKVSGGMDS